MTTIAKTISEARIEPAVPAPNTAQADGANLALAAPTPRRRRKNAPKSPGSEAVPTIADATLCDQHLPASRTSQVTAPARTHKTLPHDQPSGAAAPPSSKSETVLKLLRNDGGASLAQLQAATGWQTHSVRGFFSGTVRKRMKLILTSEPDDDGVRRYALATPRRASS